MGFYQVLTMFQRGLGLNKALERPKQATMTCHISFRVLSMDGWLDGWMDGWMGRTWWYARECDVCTGLPAFQSAAKRRAVRLIATWHIVQEILRKSHKPTVGGINTGRKNEKYRKQHDFTWFRRFFSVFFPSRFLVGLPTQIVKIPR